MSEEKMHQAKAIQEARNKKGLTQKQIADGLGVHVQMISNIERGAAPLPRKYYSFISEALGIPMRKLIALKAKDVRDKILQELE
jgi:transcriptional regulator with XRE-family HTH domain